MFGIEKHVLSDLRENRDSRRTVRAWTEKIWHRKRSRLLVALKHSLSLSLSLSLPLALPLIKSSLSRILDSVRLQIRESFSSKRESGPATACERAERRRYEGKRAQACPPITPPMAGRYLQIIAGDSPVIKTGRVDRAGMNANAAGRLSSSRGQHLCLRSRSKAKSRRALLIFASEPVRRIIHSRVDNRCPLRRYFNRLGIGSALRASPLQIPEWKCDLCVTA